MGATLSSIWARTPDPVKNAINAAGASIAGALTSALVPVAEMIAASKRAIIAFYALQMILHVVTNLEYYNAKVVEAFQTVLLPLDLVLAGYAVFLLLAAVGCIWRAGDPAGFNMFVNTIDNGVFNGFLGVAPQPPPAQGIFRGLFGQGGRGAAAAAEAAAQERSRVRRRVSESPGFFERTGHAMDTYLTPPRRGQHPQ